MTKKIAVLLVLALMVSLCGCQLAKGEALMQTGTNPQDAMIGVFVTLEHLDLFDIEAYLNDHMNDIMFSDGEVIEDTSEYEGRIYAVPEYNEDGTLSGDYTFADLEGYMCFTPIVTMDEVATHVSNMDSCFADLHIGSHVKDDEQEESLAATMYVVDDLEEYLFFLNPVYQDENGNVYLMAGTGISTMSGWIGEMSQSMDNEIINTVDGKSTTERYSVKITFKGVPRPEQIVVLQMDAQSNVLSREEYQPGTLPEQIMPVDGAAYFVVETHNAQKVTREVISDEDRWMNTYVVAENGVCEQQSTEVLWKDWDAEE